MQDGHKRTGKRRLCSCLVGGQTGLDSASEGVLLVLEKLQVHANAGIRNCCLAGRLMPLRWFL
eukprot:FN601674.1.p3 GENE.FN601674.1~~FN601674.1.p3  ORF type:complete len:63 (-),score=3.16 FN601674.1:53-241(-)